MKEMCNLLIESPRIHRLLLNIHPPQCPTWAQDADETMAAWEKLSPLEALTDDRCLSSSVIYRWIIYREYMALPLWNTLDFSSDGLVYSAYSKEMDQSENPDVLIL